MALQKNNIELAIEFDLIAQKKFQDLIVALEGNTKVIFDDYFSKCTDLSCLTSLPSANTLYHVVNDNFITLKNFELIYFYGDKTTLTDIAQHQTGLLEFLNQLHVESSGGDYPTLTGLDVLALAGGNGGNGSSVDNTSFFTITGNIIIGQVISASGYNITVYKIDGEELKTSVTIDNDGSFSIVVKESYTGAIVVRFRDTGSSYDYKDEGSGQNKDLTVDLRTITTVSNSNTVININQLLKISTCKLFKDMSNRFKLSDIDVSTGKTIDTLITDVNTVVAKVFSLANINLITLTPVPVAVNAKKDYNANYNNHLKAKFESKIDSTTTNNDTAFSDNANSDFVTKNATQTITATLQLSNNAIYKTDTIKIRQIDLADNVSIVQFNQQDWIIDNTPASYKADEKIIITRVLKADDSVKALQDKAGNAINAITEKTHPVDSSAPTISSITDNVGSKTSDVSNANSNTVTDDRILEIKLSINNTKAVKGYKVQFYDDNTKLFSAYTLDKNDISRNYKNITPYLDSSSKGKNYKL